MDRSTLKKLQQMQVQKMQAQRKSWKETTQVNWQVKVYEAEKQAEAEVEKQNGTIDIQIFNFDSESIRVVMQDGEPWFVAKDVCDVLGLSNARMAVSSLEDWEKNTVSISYGIRGNPNMNIINESGLYSLVFKSNKPEAKAFKQWVNQEVLPSIRKFGAYITPDKLQEITNDPEAINTLLPKLNQALANKVLQDTPKVQFADSITNSNALVSINVLSKLLQQNGVSISPMQLFEWMRRKGFLIKQKGCNWNVPIQQALKNGLLEVKINKYAYANGDVQEVPTPMVTGKGQQYFINRFLSGREGVYWE